MRDRTKVSMNLKDWLSDLAKYNYVDVIDGEVQILPIYEVE